MAQQLVGLLRISAVLVLESLKSRPDRDQSMGHTRFAVAGTTLGLVAHGGRNSSDSADTE